MKRQLLAAIVVSFVCAGQASGQTVIADQVRLNTGPCLIKSGSGSPEGVVTAGVCSTYLRTDTGVLYFKLSGTSNIGWVPWSSVNVPSSPMARDASNGTELTTLQNPAGLLTLSGSIGTRITGGGFHVGDAGVPDPGLGNTALDGFIGSNNFASETIGWRCTFTGNCDMRYLFSDEMRVKLFVADLEAVIAGSQRIVKSHSTVAFPFTCPAPGNSADLYVFDSKVFGNAAVFDPVDPPTDPRGYDWVVIRTMDRGALGTAMNITDCVGLVSGYMDLSGADEGTQRWAFTRDPNYTGQMVAGSVVPVETLVQDLGKIGDGFVESTAVDGAASENAPYTQIVTWALAPVSANFTVRSRFGNLKGITGTDGEYGLIAGTYAGADGQYLKASNLGVALHGIDLIMWDGAISTFQVRRNSGRPYLSVGSPAPNVFGGSGAFMGWSGTAAQFSLYTNATNYLFYDGSKLSWSAANTTLDTNGNLTATSATLSGSITASGGAIGGWLIGSTFFYDLFGMVGMSSAVTGADDVRIWAGCTVIATCPVRIYESGSFHFGGAGGAIDWNGSALTISGEGSGLTSINGGNITTGSITANQIAAATITASKIAAATITASQIAANTITAAQIAAGTITATEIAANTITAAQLNVTSLSAISSNLGTMTGGSLNIGSGAFAVNSSGVLTATGATLDSLIVANGFVVNGGGPSLATFNVPIKMSGFVGGGGTGACIDNAGFLYRAPC